VRGREGNRLKNSAPLDNWETADGQYICIVAAGDGLFPRLAKAMGRPSCSTTRASRRSRRASPTATRSTPSSASGAAPHRREIEAIMVAAEVPVSRAYSIADIAADPHYAAREDIVTVDDPTLGPLKHPAVYPRLSATPAASAAARRSSASTTTRSIATCSGSRLKTSRSSSGGTAVIWPSQKYRWST
jgi:formyl-CoA transferase